MSAVLVRGFGNIDGAKLVAAARRSGQHPASLLAAETRLPARQNER